VSHELKDQRNHGEYQQNMDEPAERETAHNTHKPQGEQDDE